MSFGYALKKFREERGLSLREFAKLCDIDHAYIHRLEKDEKTAPSVDAVDTFVQNLKLNARQTRMLRFLAGRRGLEDLVQVFLEDGARPLDTFESLAQMSFRGKRPDNKDEWRKWAERLENMMNE